MNNKYDNWTASDAIDRRLLDEDTHYLSGDISNENISEAIKWILAADLDAKTKRTLKLYINTYGGDLYEAFALIDIMKNSKHTISTFGIGAIMSAGFLIFAAGEPGERYIGKNASAMNHQHSHESPETKMHDMRAAMKENQNLEMRTLHLLKDATGMTVQEVRNKFIKNPSDQYYTAKQLVDLGVADHIL